MSMKHVAAESIKGLTMLGAEGDIIGDVANLCIDPESWRVASIQVNLRKEAADRLGAERSLFHATSLEIPVSMIQSVGDAVILSVATAGLNQALELQRQSQDASTQG
jgi:sporulation protein YlmC with PRC-barrel domain